MQGELEEAWWRATGLREGWTLAGRTDAGVSASRQVASASTLVAAGVAELQELLSSELPPDVQLASLREAPAGFNARHDARWRAYEYRLPASARGWLDAAAMARGGESLIGERDFAALASSAATGPRGTVRRVLDLGVERERPTGDLVVRVVADAFLRQMVRRIVGALTGVGSGRISGDELIRAVETRERMLLPGPAPAEHLVLKDVGYGEPTE